MTILFWSVFALVVAVWAAAEWIFARRVLDICRGGPRRQERDAYAGA